MLSLLKISWTQKGIYHRDLRDGNIMLNLGATIENGEPLVYIIDFGRSAHAHSDEHAYARKVSPDRTVFAYPKDHGKLNEVQAVLEKHILNRDEEGNTL